MKLPFLNEVRDALGRFSESTVRNWITRSLRGAPTELVRGQGHNPPVETVIKKLKTMHGAVSPLDVMIRRLFTLSQGKSEHISAFATRLETAINSIQQDHPGQLTQATIQSSLHNRFYQGLRKTYMESLLYLYATKAPYEEILTAARAVEAEQEDYKEAGGATAKAAQGTDPELLEELASIKAMVKKAWNAQQNSQQKQKKQGDGKRDANNNPSGKKKKNDTCYGCGGTGHFVKDCPYPHKSSLNSKRRGKKGNTLVYPNFVPFDAILDVGSSISMIDVKVCETLGLPVNPFSCDIFHCVGVEGASMVRSLISVLRWIKVELGILGLGCILARFRVTVCIYDKAVPVVLESDQIKKVYNQARIENINY